MPDDRYSQLVNSRIGGFIAGNVGPAAAGRARPLRSPGSR